MSVLGVAAAAAAAGSSPPARKSAASSPSPDSGLVNAANYAFRASITCKFDLESSKLSAAEVNYFDYL